MKEQIDLCIEECKSKAHAAPWLEEVELLQEEMMRVKAFFGTWTEMWHQQVKASGTRTDLDPVVKRGMEAYLREQAGQFQAMHGCCEHS